MKVSKGKGPVKKEKKEVLKPVEDRKLGKRKAALKAVKSSNKRAKNAKSAKNDPNKPKRPPSAFFIFLGEFRKVYKQEHPNIKAVSAVGKAGGEKWKSFTDSVPTNLASCARTGLTTNPAQVDVIGFLMAWPSQCQSVLDHQGLQCQTKYLARNIYCKHMASLSKKCVEKGNISICTRPQALGGLVDEIV